MAPRPVGRNPVGKTGIPGVAVLFGSAALYLVYVGVNNIPFFDGLRSLLQGQKPISKEPTGVSATDIAGKQVSGGPDKGIEKLVGYAATAHPRFKSQFPNLTIFGWRSVGSVPNSDHPKGKALDIMHPTSAQASAIIFMFRAMPGAKQWIWNNQTAFRRDGWIAKAYLGPNPHTDHVHLSFE